MDTDPPLRFVTASLQVSFLKPTPLGVPLEIRGKVKEIKGRKVVVESTVSARDEITARGEVVAVRMPENMLPKS
jgi:acyl-CoA thioesterase FadM